MANPYIGEIKLVPFTFAPVGWAMCDGSVMKISDNQALYAVIGTLYGGDGVSTFALPDMRSRAPIHAGQGPGLSSYQQGTAAGAEMVTLTTDQLPTHNHSQAANSTTASGTNSPTGAVHGTDGTAEVYSAGQNAQMSSQSIQPAGGGLGHTNIQPVLAVNYAIALVGIFPSRS